MEIKNLIVSLGSSFFQFIDKILVQLRVVRPRVIYCIDSGLCDQMLRYLEAQYYADDARIYYDITWYEKEHISGVASRDFELTEMFPNLDFHTISSGMGRFYKIFFGWKERTLPDKLGRTTFFGGHYELQQAADFGSLFAKYFKPSELRDIDFSISAPPNGKSVAVHIRRGDLANYEDEWYKTVPSSYFFNAISYVEQNFNNVHLYFFSDDLDWVKENICPSVMSPYTLVSGNKAYEDLILISQCDVVIASQGSFGPYGARLNGHSTFISPQPDNRSDFVVMQLKDGEFSVK